MCVTATSLEVKNSPNISSKNTAFSACLAMKDSSIASRTILCLEVTVYSVNSMMDLIVGMFCAKTAVTAFKLSATKVLSLLSTSLHHESHLQRPKVRR